MIIPMGVSTLGRALHHMVHLSEVITSSRLHIVKHKLALRAHHHHLEKCWIKDIRIHGHVRLISNTIKVNRLKVKLPSAHLSVKNLAFIIVFTLCILEL